MGYCILDETQATILGFLAKPGVLNISGCFFRLCRLSRVSQGQHGRLKSPLGVAGGCWGVFGCTSLFQPPN